MEILLVLDLVVMVAVLVFMQIVAVMGLVVREEVSDGDNGDLIGVGNAGASADACDNGGGVGDDGGSHFGVDCEGCVVVMLLGLLVWGLVMMVLVLVLVMGVMLVVVMVLVMVAVLVTMVA